MQTPAHPSDEALDALEAFIFSDAVSEDSLDLIGIHGFFCALNIRDNGLQNDEWLEIIFDGSPNWQDDTQKAALTQTLLDWKSSILSDLYNDRELEMPCELSLQAENNEEPELEIWAQAFMEAVFLQEEAWFQEGTANEEVIAELMLPIMLASNLFDEPEFAEIRQKSDLLEQMASEIPDILVDLYLLYNAPEK